MGRDFDARFEGEIVQRVGVGQGNRGGLLKLSFESEVKVGNIALEDEGQFLWIGHNAFHNSLVVCKGDFADDRREGFIKQLNNLQRRVFAVAYKDVSSPPFLGTFEDEGL